MTLPALSLLETRILGVLVEKQHTVPDTYPLTLNALVAGCNQKTSRDPIVTASEAEVQATIDHLRSLSLIVESSGGRVMRYAHNVERVLALPSQAVALLAALMLRGPQTVAELRVNSERFHRFADLSAVEGFLHELAERAGRRARGRVAAPARHPRDALGAPAVGAAGCRDDTCRGDDRCRRRDAVTVGEIAALKANVAQLARRARMLKATVAKLCARARHRLVARMSFAQPCHARSLQTYNTHRMRLPVRSRRIPHF